MACDIIHKTTGDIRYTQCSLRPKKKRKYFISAFPFVGNVSEPSIKTMGARSKTKLKREIITQK